MTDVFEFVFPGLMLMWVCFISQGVYADIFVEFKANTLSRVLASGVSLRQFLLSKMLRCLVVCWICELLLILFTGLVFGVGWRNPPMLFVVLTSFNLLLIGLLSLIYAYVRSAEAANAIVVFLFMMAAVLGGSFVPFSELPAALQRVGEWTMIRLANTGIENLMQSRPLWDSLRPSLILAVAGTVLAGIGNRVLRKRIETGGLA